MIDLNVRLDSSLNDEDYHYLSRLQQLDNVEITPLLVNDHHRDDYLSAREKALGLLQSGDAINYAIRSLIHRLYREGCLYAEITVTPTLHLKSGLILSKLFKALLGGLYDALDKCPDMDANIIVNLERSCTYRENLQVVDYILKLQESKIVAIGLEGDDKGHPLSSYQRLFASVKKANIPLVIELGNKYNSNEVIERAIKKGAKRIIAPYGLELDNKLLMLLRQNNVYLEFRPTFDLINDLCEKMEDLPLKSLIYRGYPYYIAVCSYTICNSSLAKELKSLCLAREEMQMLFNTMISAAFISTIKQAKLIRYYAEDFPRFYSKLN